jgi:hypothetical protein
LDAYLAAFLAKDSTEAPSYWDPDLQTEVVEICQQGVVLSAEKKGSCRLTEYDIEEVLVEDTASGKSIHFSGYFHHICDDASRDYQTEDLKLFYNHHDGEWRITGIDG